MNSSDAPYILSDPRLRRAFLGLPGWLPEEAAGIARIFKIYDETIARAKTIKVATPETRRAARDAKAVFVMALCKIDRIRAKRAKVLGDLADAAEAGAGAASIPFIGPELAAAAMASMVALVAHAAGNGAEV